MKTTPSRSSSLLLLLIICVACSPPVDNQTRLDIARDHAARGDHVTAILELKNLLQNDPGDLTATSLLGQLSLYAGQSAEAIVYLRQARALGAPPEQVLVPLGRALLAQGQFERLLSELDPADAPADYRSQIRLLQAEALADLGRTDEARDAYLAARRDRSTEAQALAGLAQLAITAGRYDEAEELLGQALDADPFAVVAHRTVGALKIEQQQYAEALESFVRAVEATGIRPGADDLLLARVGMAESQWRLGQKNRALGNVKDLLDAYPWHPLPRYLRALLAFDNAEYELASEYLREVLSIVPRHAPSKKLLAASEFELGHYANSEMLLRQYLQDEPGDIAMRRLLAATHLQMGNPPGAMAVLLPAVNSARNDSQFLELLGRASLHSGDAATAVSYFDRAMHSDPDNRTARLSLIVALIGAGQTERAEQHLHALPPGDSAERARKLLELVLLMRKAERERALQYAKDLRQAAPSNLHAMLALAEMAEARGDSERAIDWLEMARTRNPQAVEPRLLLVEYYQRRKQHDLAHSLAVEAVQIRPHQAEALIALAQAKLDIGQPDEAMGIFEEALRASPESGEALLGLAFATARAGRLGEASGFLTRAVDTDPALMPRAVRLVLELADAGSRKDALRLADNLQKAAEHLPYGYTAAGDLHMAERRFTEALAAYEAAMQLSDDPIIAVKSFIAAREAGLAQPAAVLERWLAKHPDDKRVRRILASAENTTS